MLEAFVPSLCVYVYVKRVVSNSIIIGGKRNEKETIV